MNIEKRLINQILILSSLIIIVIISVFLYVYFNPKNLNPGCATESIKPFCGTELTSPEKLKGKVIFNANCAACHRMNSKNNILKNALKGFPDEKYFYNYLTNEDSLIKIKDKQNKVINEMFEGDYNHNFKLSQEEVKNLKEYIK
jgi:cytochrome c